MDFNMVGLNEYQINETWRRVGRFNYEQERRADAIFTLSRLYSEIDAVSNLKGAGVCYIDSEDSVYKLREFNSIERDRSLYIVLREPPGSVKISDFGVYIRQNQASSRELNLMNELIALGFNCGGVAIGWIGMAMSGVGSITTFGLSSVTFVISMSSAFAGVAQCTNSAIRVIDQLAADGEISRRLDSDEWYQNTMNTLEIISLASAGKGLLKILKTHFLSGGRPALGNAIESLNRRQRLSVSVDLMNRSDSNSQYYFNILRGRIAQSLRNRAVYNTSTISSLVEALESSLTIAGNIKTHGRLNPRAGIPEGLSIGILEEG